MDQERIKLIVKNMELLVDALKKELTEVQEVQEFDEGDRVVPFSDDYDEVFSE